MPWVTPTLETLRTLNRDNVQSQLRSGPMIPNSVLRVMSDSNAGLAYLALLYVNWLSLQLLPDTAETEWLDRHAAIWLPSNGRKPATFAQVVTTFTGIGGITLPGGSLMAGADSKTLGVEVPFQSKANVVIGITATNVSAVATVAGATGLVVGSQLSLEIGISGINGVGIITSITDGIDAETDDELRARVLARIQQPPVGGDAEDYVQWTTNTPTVSVTRAWCSPLEMGAGTVTVRFMTDTFDSQGNPVVGFPSQASLNAVLAYINTVRPVAIKDLFVEPPVPEPVSFTVSNLSPDSVANRAAIIQSVNQMLFDRAAPAHAVNGIEQSAQTIFASWVSEAISEIGTIDSFTLLMEDHVMPFPGSMGVLGNVVYG